MYYSKCEEQKTIMIIGIILYMAPALDFLIGVHVKKHFSSTSHFPFDNLHRHHYHHKQAFLVVM